MKKIIIASMLANAFSAQAQVSVGIGSGQPTGTNYPMVEDIVKVCSSPKITYRNVPTDGALDNLFKIYGDKKVQYGIVDEATLVYQQGLDPTMMKQIQMVFPFFSMELHLAVKEGSPIKSLNDLRGKKVYEGAEGSSTWVSTQVVKSITGVSWEGESFSQTEAMAALQSGKVDAIFIVAGMPVGLFSKASGVRLVPLNDPKLDQFGYYTKTMVPNGTYPFMTKSVSTYKVNNIIATYAFKNQYQREIGEFVGCIAHNIDTLRAEGHAKWRSVDPLDIERTKWQSHPAAVAAIKRELKK